MYLFAFEVYIALRFISVQHRGKMDPLHCHDPMPPTVGTTAQSALRDLLSLDMHLSGEKGVPASPALKMQKMVVERGIPAWASDTSLWKSMKSHLKGAVNSSC